MKMIKSAAFVVLTVLVCRATWLLFYYFTPAILKFEWYWFLVAFAVYAIITDALSIFITRLKSYSKVENILVLLFAVVGCYICMKMSWYYMETDKVATVAHNLLAIGAYGVIALTFRSSPRRK